MEQLEIINRRLLDHFGRFDDGRPLWRISWTTGQTEMRYNDHLDVVMEMVKYPFNQDRHVLERLVPVPALNNKELFTKTSYEPVWFFETENHSPLPPLWDVCKIVIDKVYEVSAKAVGKVYKDPLAGQEREVTKQRIDELEAALFGNESQVGDAIATKNAVVLDNRDMEIK